MAGGRKRLLGASSCCTEWTRPSSRFCARSCGVGRWSSFSPRCRQRSASRPAAPRIIDADRARAHGAAAAAAGRESICPAQQEQCRRRRGDLRGDEPAADALRAGQDGRAAGGADAGRVRDGLVRRRTRLANAIRGHAAEFGLVAAKGHVRIEPLLERIAEDETVPELARALFAELGEDYRRLSEELGRIQARLMAWHRQNELSRRLAEIPSVGPIGASLLVMKVPDPGAFRSGRDFAAWIGLTPKDHSTAGKTRLSHHAGRRRAVAQRPGGRRHRRTAAGAGAASRRAPRRVVSAGAYKPCGGRIAQRVIVFTPIVGTR
jgi:hypothetical protein